METDPKKLFERLLMADSEADVISILQAEGYWDDRTVWRFYGDQSENWATVGNQQSRAEQALIEKLTNSIDSKLIASARIKGIPITGRSAPQSVFEARDLLFGEERNDIGKLSNSVTVATTGSRSRPCITIVDDGEGQTPSDMPSTILSLHKGNKNAIPFVQGKFNMGGSGVLEFCGKEHNVELVLSKRNPSLLSNDATNHDRQWSFTVIRREDPGPESPRASRFTYLAPRRVGESANELLTFDAEALSIFPNKNKAYARNVEWGTLFKMYEYGTRAKGNMMLEGGLMGRIRILLPEPALPIRFHECRDYGGDPNRSFDTPMAGLIYTLEEDRKNPKRKNVEWYDKFLIDVDGEQFFGRIYLFRKRGKDENGKEEKKNPAENYRKDEGIVFTYNGQCQAFFTKDFFRRQRVKQDYLWDSLLVFVDCSAIGTRAHEQLFMPNRENLRQKELKVRLEKELEEKLHDHKELQQIANARRKEELSDNPEVSKHFEKFVEDMLKKHPSLEKVLGAGFRIPNPFKPHAVEASEKPWMGVRFPTKFHFRDRAPSVSLQRDAYLNSQVRIAFTTDAENDYFRRDEQPGEFKLFRVIDGELTSATNWRTPHLFEGNVTLSLSLPPDTSVGDEIVYEAQVMDASRIEPICNRFSLAVKPEREATIRDVCHQPSRPRNKASSQTGKGAQTETKLDVPKPADVWEPNWGVQDPPFDKYTAMRIKRKPGENDEADGFDYAINMNNIFIDQAVKEKPRKAKELRNRYRFGMTMVALSLIRYDMEKEKQAQESQANKTEALNRLDIHETVANVTSAIAPFLLPLVDSLAQVSGGDYEPLSEVAGEIA